MFTFFRSKPQPGTAAIFKIQGMHCTSCALTIDDALEDMDGVFSADTQFASAKTKVRFDETKISHQDLIKKIDEQGYQAELDPSGK